MINSVDMANMIVFSIPTINKWYEWIWKRLMIYINIYI